ncbi:cytochrome C [Sphingomonas oleivorans]|uniref:Cytochrome C n=2 Tax=Sphingomonas oleivorans TaxID=1735121 RepID=A0A2T5FUR1_9SPHN|nr:cytochrome C [Sphingomonas oleivorans]
MAMSAPLAAAPMAKPPAFAVCAACHATTPDARKGIGPNLYGISGRKAGAGSFAYSPAMKSSGIAWDREKLTAFIINPRTVVPGNKMPFAGQKNPKAAAEIADYLISLK